MSEIIHPYGIAKEELIDCFSAFIRQKGIAVAEGVIEENTFFPGIKIMKGSLVIDRKKLQYPGDLLHEAGHIAVAPPEERSKLSDNVTVNRPGTEGEEMSVMLWTWAASIQLHIPAEIIFHPAGYKGDSQWIIEQYSSGNYVGLPLLIWMGMTRHAEEPGGFPEMIKWVRE